MTKLEQHKKKMAFINFQILESLLSIVEKYETTNAEDILNYGKSALVFQNITKITPKDEEHRILRRTQINQSVNVLIDILNNIEGEGRLSNLDKDEFDEICSQILEGKELTLNEVPNAVVRTDSVITVNGLATSFVTSKKASPSM